LFTYQLFKQNGKSDAEVSLMKKCTRQIRNACGDRKVWEEGSQPSSSNLGSNSVADVYCRSANNVH